MVKELSDILVESHTKISFADKLKDAVSVLFDWDRETLEGETSKVGETTG